MKLFIVLSLLLATGCSDPLPIKEHLFCGPPGGERVEVPYKEFHFYSGNSRIRIVLSSAIEVDVPASDCAIIYEAVRSE